MKNTEVYKLLQRLVDIGEEVKSCDECPLGNNMCDILNDYNCPFSLCEAYIYAINNMEEEVDIND